MAGMKLSNLDFLRLLPAFMRDDEAAIGLSKAMDKLLGDLGGRLETLRTWDKIDDLTEAECDELAWELSIDWYDSTGMSLEEKRETIKVAQQIKRKRGTKWAVERLISAYFGEGYVSEWYETGGEPFTFTVMTTNPDIVAENYNKFLQGVQAAKNERSHMSHIFFYWPFDPSIEAVPTATLHRYDFPKCGTKYRPGTLGAVKNQKTAAAPSLSFVAYKFTKCGTRHCGE